MCGCVPSVPMDSLDMGRLYPTDSSRYRVQSRGSCSYINDQVCGIQGN